MLPIHTILHPTDYSDRSQQALQLACALARDYGAGLIVLHAETMPIVGYSEEAIPLDPGPMMEEAKEQLRRLEIPDTGLPVDRRFSEGDPVEEILRVAKEVCADLIVMGTHGRTGLDRLLMGSVAEQVVRRAYCPVLTVKAPIPVSVPAAGRSGAAPALV